MTTDELAKVIRGGVEPESDAPQLGLEGLRIYGLLSLSLKEKGE